jgi:hypothetical protein
MPRRHPDQLEGIFVYLFVSDLRYLRERYGRNNGVHLVVCKIVRDWVESAGAHRCYVKPATKEATP